MGTSVNTELHGGVIGDKTVLHARQQPQEVVPKPILKIPHWHLRHVPMAYVEDSSLVVHFSPRRDENGVTAVDSVVIRIDSRDGRIGGEICSCMGRRAPWKGAWGSW